LIGAKSITSCLLAGVAAWAAWRWELLDPGGLRDVGPTALFWVGFSGLVVGTWVFRFWRLHERSTYGFRFARGGQLWEDEAHFLGTSRHRITFIKAKGAAWDLPAPLQHLLYVTLAFGIGLVTLDSRAIELIKRLPDNMTLLDSEYCPRPEAATTEAGEPDQPGCALVRRAYALGYAKSLGACETKHERESAEICTLRQHDEPFLHFGWRRLAEATAAGAGLTTAAYWDAMQADFLRKSDHLGALYDLQASVIASRPRASHHIWTNLPDPGDWLARASDGTLTLEPCSERYQQMAAATSLPTEASLYASRLLDHVVGELLFDGRYVRPAADCRSFTFHWGAPADVCASLRETPAGTLTRYGAAAAITEVAQRRTHAARVAALRQGAAPVDLADAPDAAAAPAADAGPELASISCYIEEARDAPQRRSDRVMFAGMTLRVEELRTPPTLQVDGFPASAYRNIAALLAPGFHYSALSSDAAIDPAAPQDDAAMAGKRGSFFTGLQQLQDIDLLVGDSPWLDRSDLLAVYPYHIHMKNFVHLFRRRYLRLGAGR